MTNIKKRVKDARARFDAEIKKIAEGLRAQMVPIFKNRGWRYLTGNGTWYIVDANGVTIKDEDAPKRFVDLLSTEVDSCQLLGFYVLNIE